MLYVHWWWLLILILTDCIAIIEQYWLFALLVIIALEEELFASLRRVNTKIVVSICSVSNKCVKISIHEKMFSFIVLEYILLRIIHSIPHTLQVLNYPMNQNLNFRIFFKWNLNDKNWVDARRNNTIGANDGTMLILPNLK